MSDEKEKEPTFIRISWQELEEATKPIKELLQKKGHPHMKVIVDQAGAEVVEGICSCPFEILD